MDTKCSVQCTVYSVQMKKMQIYAVILAVFALLAGSVYSADSDLEELSKTLVAQEKDAQGKQAKSNVSTAKPTEVKTTPVLTSQKEKQPKKEVQERKLEVAEVERKPKSNIQPRTVSVNNKGYVEGKNKVDVVRAIPVSSASNLEMMYKEAIKCFEAHDFDKAKVLLAEVIEINPLHIPAKHLLQRIIEDETGHQVQDNVISAKESINDVDKVSLPPEKVDQKEEENGKKEQIKSPQQLLMEEKAKQVIPEINFTDAHIRDVIKYLSDVSGINIVIDEDIFPKIEKAESVKNKIDVDGNGEESVSEEPEMGVVSDRITISLINIPLIEALKYILSAKGLKYRIDEYAIVVSTPEKLSSVEMETRYYHLSSGLGIFTEFVKKMQTEEEQAGGVKKGLKAESKITIKDVLEQSGVPFPAGSKVFLDKRTGTLIVRNTAQNLGLVEEVLRMLDITPFQVEIEARFIEVTEEKAQELGLEWIITSPDYRFYSDKLRLDNKTTDAIYGQYPDPAGQTGREGLTHGMRYLDEKFLSDSPYQFKPSGNILSLSGILTQPEFRAILHALNQSGFSNVLSAPKVTTLNNQQSQIEVVKEIIYPTEFELTPATTNDFGSIVTQPVVTPAAWTTRDIGIILNVTPSVGADKKTVNLSLKPEVSKFLEWKDYGISKGANWSAIPIKQPIFFSQNVDTNVVVNDGETVVLGGLIKEDTVVTEDKIPVLGDIPIVGRLFRSNTERSKKTNLIIFVTANLLSPTGERIRQ